MHGRIKTFVKILEDAAPNALAFSRVRDIYVEQNPDDFIRVDQVQAALSEASRNGRWPILRGVKRGTYRWMSPAEQTRRDSRRAVAVNESKKRHPAGKKRGNVITFPTENGVTSGDPNLRDAKVNDRPLAPPDFSGSVAPPKPLSFEINTGLPDGRLVLVDSLGRAWVARQI